MYQIDKCIKYLNLNLNIALYQMENLHNINIVVYILKVY